MTGSRSPDDEETSVFTALPQQPVTAAAPVAPAPPSPYPPPAAVPPSVVPPVYPAYAANRAAGYQTSGRAVLAGLILLLFGAVEATAGTAGAIAASTLRRVFDQLMRDQGIRIESSALTSVLTAIFLTMLLLGVLQLVAGGGVLAHRRWARTLGILLSLAGVVAGGWLVYRLVGPGAARTNSIAGPLLVLVPYLIALLGLLFPANHFRRGWR